MSTAEAEYIALTSAACEVLYLKSLIGELYEPITLSISIYCDNQGAIALALNNKFHVCTKHIDIHYHFIHALIQDNMLDLKYIPTDDNLADAFTKALPRARLEKLRADMSVDCTQGGVL